MFNTIFPKIHKEGYKFLAISVIATFIILLFSKFFGLFSVLLTIWVYYFFRDPDRISIEDDNYLTSPADGLVLSVKDTNGPAELNLQDKSFKKISIFMNVFDCICRIYCDLVISFISTLHTKIIIFKIYLKIGLN